MKPEREWLIEAKGVTRTLPLTVPVTLVRDIDLSIGKGEMIAITGPSGSGKSSLLYLLGLLDVPSQGEIRIQGHATAALSEARRAAMRLQTLGFVFQFHFLLPELTILENVMLPMRKLGRLDRRAIAARADELLIRLGLDGLFERRPDQISGGQRQRVAVARAVANDPPILLADEPTGSLDSRSTEQVIDILKSMVEDGSRSVIAVTHDMDLAAAMRRRIHLVDGRIVSDES